VTSILSQGSTFRVLLPPQGVLAGQGDTGKLNRLALAQ